VPTAKPITAAATANTSHPMTAALRCSELHRPARAARFHRLRARGSAGPRPGCPAALIAVWPTTPPPAFRPPLPARRPGLWIDREDLGRPVLPPRPGLVDADSLHAPPRLSCGPGVPTRMDSAPGNPSHPSKGSGPARRAGAGPMSGCGCSIEMRMPTSASLLSAPVREAFNTRERKFSRPGPGEFRAASRPVRGAGRARAVPARSDDGGEGAPPVATGADELDKAGDRALGEQVAKRRVVRMATGEHLAGPR
jgi:hypothetical protein